MKKKAVILDYGIGNIKSLENLLEKLNYSVCLSNKKVLIDNCDLIVLPGVGKYNRAVSNLKKNNLFNYIKKKIIKDRIPTVGICLGMQLLFEQSEENINCKGLNIFKQKIVKLKSANIGWSTINFKDKNKNELYKNNFYYFNHGYAFNGNLSFSKSFIANQYSINAIILHKNILGFQFHPEKSQTNGEKIFKDLIKNII